MDAIKKARQRLGLTQRQLASLIGVTHGAIGNYESGYRSVDVRHVRRLCDVLGIRPHDLRPDVYAPTDEAAA